MQVREPDLGVVVEDVRGGERVRLATLADLPDLIARWLEAGREPNAALTTEEEA